MNEPTLVTLTALVTVAGRFWTMTEADVTPAEALDRLRELRVRYPQLEARIEKADGTLLATYRTPGGGWGA